MNTDTLPQPAHGEPPLSGRWRHSNGVLCCGTLRIATDSFDTDPSEEFKGELWSWVCEKLNTTPDLSAVEVHSKETMDEVREILESVDTHILNSKATPEAHTPERMLSIRIHYALAKLNPPQG